MCSDRKKSCEGSQCTADRQTAKELTSVADPATSYECVVGPPTCSPASAACLAIEGTVGL